MAQNVITSTTNSTSVSTGALIVRGGIGCTGSIYAGGPVWVNAGGYTSDMGANTKLGVGGTTQGSGMASVGHISVGGTVVGDTGISINQTECGGTILMLASQNTDVGLNTASATYLFQFYYNGDNAPLKTYLGGSSDFVTFGVSASKTLTVTSNGTLSVSWFGNK